MAAAIADAFVRIRAAGFVGTATPLADIDLPLVGYDIGAGEDEIHVVINVEAAGSGFNKLKRQKILFERRRFYANLPGDKCARTASLGLAHPPRGQVLHRLLRRRRVGERWLSS